MRCKSNHPCPDVLHSLCACSLVNKEPTRPARRNLPMDKGYGNESARLCERERLCKSCSKIQLHAVRRSAVESRYRFRQDLRVPPYAMLMASRSLLVLSFNYGDGHMVLQMGNPPVSRARRRQPQGSYQRDGHVTHYGSRDGYDHQHDYFIVIPAAVQPF